MMPGMSFETRYNTYYGINSWNPQGTRIAFSAIRPRDALAEKTQRTGKGMLCSHRHQSDIRDTAALIPGIRPLAAGPQASPACEILKLA
jgi:hypothetical protein